MFAPLGRVGMTEAFLDRNSVLERYSATRRAGNLTLP